MRQPKPFCDVHNALKDHVVTKTKSVFICRPCERARSKERHIRDREKHSRQQAASYQKHREARLASAKRYVAGLSEEERERARKYRSELSKTAKYRYSLLKSSARLRRGGAGIPVTLTFEEFCIAADSPCTYCGGRDNPARGGGLDRVDNAVGYTFDNVIAACAACNRLRGERLTVDETRAAVAAVQAARGEARPFTWPRVTVEMSSAT